MIIIKLCLSKPPVVMAGRRPAMTTGRPKADPGWLFKKTAIWRCEIVMESDRVSYLKVSRGYKVLSMILDLHVHFPYDSSDLTESLSRLSRHKQQQRAYMAGERRTTLSSRTNACIPIYPYTIIPT